MDARRSGVRRGVVAVVMASAAGLMVACATSPTPELASVGFVRDVLVDEDVDGRVITLVGVEGATHTSFTTSEPHAVVIDLAGVRVDGDASRIPVYDGMVEQVSLSPFVQQDGTVVTRVEVTTAETMDFEVMETPEGLALYLRPLPDYAESSFDARDEDPWAFKGSLPGNDAWTEGGETLGGMEASPDESGVMELPAPAQASLLTAVRTEVLADAVLVHLIANGAIGVTERFALSNPERFVLDLPGLETELAGKSFPVSSDRISQVRVGSHSGKVRVVIDGGSQADAFAGRRIVPSRDGLFVGFGEGDALADAMSQGVLDADADARRALLAATTPAILISGDSVDDFAAEQSATARSNQAAVVEAENEISEMHAAGNESDAFASLDHADAAAWASDEAMDSARSAEPITIHGINYDSQESLDRIAVLGDKVMEYRVLEPDPETVVVSLRGAVVAPGAEGRISARAGAPISLITTFQQPDVEGDEVRVVVKRAANLTPAVTRRGTVLFIDFPNDGTAAATPPAFSELDGSSDHAQLDSSAAERQGAPAGLALAGDATSPDGASKTAGSEAFVDPWDESDTASAAIEEDPMTVAVAEIATLPSAAAKPAAAAPPAAVEILKEGGLIDGKTYQGRRISLDFNDVPVEDVLRLIAEVSDLNVIAGDEVQGNITIRMMDVPWDQALDIVLLTKGLGFIRIGNVLRIAPSDVLKAEAEVRLQERRNLEKLEDLVVRLQPVNYAAVADATALVQRLLSERGSVIQDERTSTLIIKDIPSVVDEAIALVEAVDTQTPQVLIEAKIVEANLDFSRELGIEWSIGSQPLVDGFDSGSGPRQDLGGQDFRFYGDNSLSFSNPIKAIPTATGSLSAFLLDEKLNLEVKLQAQESSGEGKVISSPRIVTMDNRQALIEQGVSIPFQTFEQGDAKLEFIDAVLSLTVTPHITANRSIIMNLEVTRNAPDSSVETSTGSPAIAKNVAKTETLVGDGQTLVLGGIYTITKTVSYSLVPYVNRIPVLGNLFKSKRLRDERKELLIFVTPRVMADVSDIAAN